MTAFSQDLKFGLRMLLQKPLLTIGISFSLALGIGANSAVFSIVDAVLFRAMNVGNPSRLASVYVSDYSGPQYGASSYADFLDFREKTTAFEDLAAFSEISATLRSENQSARAFGLLVSDNYFPLLGVPAARGRTFKPNEAHPVLVVSHSFWQTRFGGDPALVGKTVFLNNNSFTIIGITPESFTSTDLGRTPEIFVPVEMYAQLGFEPGFTASRNTRQFSVIGRLNPGVSADQAQASLDLLGQQLAGAYPDAWKQRNQQTRRISVVAEPYARVRPEVRNVLTGLAGLFMVLVGLVLLIACSNISNMLLARAIARQKEMALRTAVGASRSRLIRQLLTESVQLSLIGSILGILLAPLCVKFLIAMVLPASNASLPIDIGLNQRVVVLTLGVGLITGLLFGLVPAIHASRTDLLLAMKDDSPGMQSRARKFGIRNLLVMTQISVSLLLLIVAGLFMRSLQKAQQVDLGYDVNVLTLRADADFLDSKDTAPQLAFYHHMLERVRSLPGVEAASFADFIPSGGGLRSTTIGVENYTPRSGENMDVNFGVVATDYFKTMRTTLVAGREFTEQDKEGAPRTAIVNETMARNFWPGQDPLGKYITSGGNRREIIGVVKDATTYIFQQGSTPFLYLPVLQNPSPGMTLHLRSKGDPTALVPAVRNEIDAVGQGVTVQEVRTLADFIKESLITLRVASTLTGVFGLLALMLAVVGVFSVINYSTSRRTREIGIRLALGAQRTDIFGMILKEALFIVIIGAGAGLVMAIASGRLLASFMFGGSGTADVAVYIALALMLIAIAVLACFIPAYKATRVGPTEALRHE